MRILLLNGNKNTSLTEALAKEARLYAGPGTEIIAASCISGPRFVASRSAEIIAAKAMLDVAAANAGKYDAVLIAISLDTALHALRELLPVPVIGMTEAACHTACMLGSRFGLVVVDSRTAEIYRERIVSYGLSGRLAAIRIIEQPAAKLYEDPDGALKYVESAARELIKEGCETVILVGAALVGLHRRIQPQLNVPILDGIACGIPMVEGLVRLKLPKAQHGSFSLPKPTSFENIDSTVAKLFGSAT